MDENVVYVCTKLILNNAIHFRETAFFFTMCCVATRALFSGTLHTFIVANMAVFVCLDKFTLSFFKSDPPPPSFHVHERT